MPATTCQNDILHTYQNDSVDHSLLLDKLCNLGIQDREHEWFVNYLNDRKQIVGYQGMLSAEKSIDVGVPQGLILGPLLFVLHVNDLPTMPHANATF